MDKRGRMILRVLINRYNPKAGNALLQFLPEEEAKAVLNLDIRSNDLGPIIEGPKPTLSRIHYSWFQTYLDRFSSFLHPSLHLLIGTRHISLPPDTTVSEAVERFLLAKINQILNIYDHIPVDYLPVTELTMLAKWSKAQLVNLADFLGIYDLASEVRGIVNKVYLKNIYTCLSPKQFHYLKMCLNKKEQIVAPRLGIDPTVQDCKKLNKIIHRRGLLRLGKGLCGQHPDLVWHISRILDKNRGSIVLKEYQPKEHPKVTEILKQQLYNVISYVKE